MDQVQCNGAAEDVTLSLLIINTSDFLSYYRVCILHKKYIYSYVGALTAHVPVTIWF